MYSKENLSSHSQVYQRYGIQPQRQPAISATWALGNRRSQGNLDSQEFQVVVAHVASDVFHVLV
jgi:hypothetical protein